MSLQKLEALVDTFRTYEQTYDDSSCKVACRKFIFDTKTFVRELRAMEMEDELKRRVDRWKELTGPNSELEIKRRVVHALLLARANEVDPSYRKLYAVDLPKRNLYDVPKIVLHKYETPSDTPFWDDAPVCAIPQSEFKLRIESLESLLWGLQRSLDLVEQILWHFDKFPGSEPLGAFRKELLNLTWIDRQQHLSGCFLIHQCEQCFTEEDKVRIENFDRLVSEFDWYWCSLHRIGEAAEELCRLESKQQIPDGFPFGPVSGTLSDLSIAIRPGADRKPDPRRVHRLHKNGMIFSRKVSGQHWEIYFPHERTYQAAQKAMNKLQATRESNTNHA